PAPHMDAVGGIPGKRPGTLRSVNGIDEAIIQGRAGTRARSGIAEEPLILAGERAAQGEIDGVVTVAPPIDQGELSSIEEFGREGSARRRELESVVGLPAHVSGSCQELERQLALYGNARNAIAWRPEPAIIHLKRFRRR